jgi:hypothetical protein
LLQGGLDDLQPATGLGARIPAAHGTAVGPERGRPATVTSGPSRTARLMPTRGS